MMADDLIIEPIDYENGATTVPSRPVWRVKLDEDALQK